MDSARFDCLLNRYLDGELALDDKQELQAKLLSDPEARRQFWLDAKLHASLRLLGEQELGAREARNPEELPEHREEKIVHVGRRFWFGAAASAAAATLVLFLGLLVTRPLNALVAMQQIIDATGRAADRTYAVKVLEGSPERPITGGRSLTLEGAIVHLRGKDRYVVIQHLTDGLRQRITGFDGEQGWSFIGKGAVNISDDPRKFRSNLPGERHNFAFTNLHDQLEDLRRRYEVQLRDADDSEVRSLLAVRKSGTVRGPREVEIWFDPDSGMIQRLDLHGLPQERGGPRAIRLELVDQHELGDDFFSHKTHHEPERRVREERP